MHKLTYKHFILTSTTFALIIYTIIFLWGFIHTGSELTLHMDLMKMMFPGLENMGIKSYMIGFSETIIYSFGASTLFVSIWNKF